MVEVWQHAALAEQALLRGTWTAGDPTSVLTRRGGREEHTPDKQGVERTALHAQPVKDTADKPRIGGIRRVRDLVAAVQLRAAAGGGCLPSRHVPADGPGVGGAATGVLAVVANKLVPGTAVAGADLRGCRDRDDRYRRGVLDGDLDGDIVEREVVDREVVDGEDVSYR